MFTSALMNYSNYFIQLTYRNLTTKHPSRECEVFSETGKKCPDCMDAEQEIDLWFECYMGKHNNAADCPTWYDGCNCGASMAKEIELLKSELRQKSAYINWF